MSVWLDEKTYITPRTVLTGAPAEAFAHVLVIGQAEDGRLYIACSDCSGIGANMAEAAIKQLETGNFDWNP